MSDRYDIRSAHPFFDVTRTIVGNEIRMWSLGNYGADLCPKQPSLGRGLFLDLMHNHQACEDYANIYGTHAEL